MNNPDIKPGMKISFLIEIEKSNPFQPLTELFVERPEFEMHLTGDDYEFLAWGDPIASDNFIRELPSGCSPDFIVNNLTGHYYYLLNDRRRREIIAGSSMFSILPVYFFYRKGRLVLSGNAFTLGRKAGLNSVSSRFILETLLFNYPLFNSSLIEGIGLLPSNSALVFSGDGYNVIKHTSVEQWFSSDPVPWRESKAPMAGKFLDTAATYLPQEYYLTALTGGFDGRTLTAAGLYHDRNFSCYCFGTDSSVDLMVASNIAEQTGIDFIPVLTDEEYVSRYSLEAGRKFILRSSGLATFSRAHYVYASSILACRTRFLVTGNFGSEIFRAVHNTGVMISPALYDVFLSRDPDEALVRLGRNPVTRFLKDTVVQSVLAGMREDIEALPPFSSKYSNLSKNQQFYVYLLEEIFRKYFGSEIVNQADYVINRTPFLDPSFLKELFGTGLAGVHSGFFEDNPFKRLKGQVLYASIIRMADPRLGRFNTGRGYSPDDLLSIAGQLKIMSARYLRRRHKQVSPYDPLGVKAAWRANNRFYRELNVDGDIFNPEVVKQSGDGELNDEKARLFSLLYSMHELKNN